MASKCLSKCSLLVVLLAVALFLSQTIYTAIAGFSGRSGGRMGGSSFSPSEYSYSTPSSSSLRGSYKSESSDSDSSFSFSGFFSFIEPKRPIMVNNNQHSTYTFSPSHFHNYHYSPPPPPVPPRPVVSTETSRRFNPPSSVSVETKDIHEKKDSGSTTRRFDDPPNSNETKDEKKDPSKKKDEKKDPSKKKDEDSNPLFLIKLLGSVLLMVASVGYLIYLTEPGCQATVLMVQVGLSGNAKLLQQDLNRIAHSADTSAVKGFHRVLQETLSVLVQHNGNWISGFSYVDKQDSFTANEKSFNQLSLGERKKVDIESLVNFNGQVRRTSTHKGNKLAKNYIVVTVIVAARGAQNLPAIKTTKDLKKAVKLLRSISVDETMAVEVLWTPQDEEDTLSEDDLLEHYHLLRPI